MTTKTITQLPSASNILGGELLEVVQVSGGFPTSLKTQARNIHQAPTKYLKFLNADQHPIPYAAQPWKEGTVEWDGVNHTMQMHNDISAMRLQIGQETIIRVINQSGEDIPDGTPVYISGSSNAVVIVAPAKSDLGFSLAGLGVTTHVISAGQSGYVTKRGLVRDIDTSLLTEGAELWVSSASAGVMSMERPVSPNRQGFIGLVVNSHSTSGSIYVDPLVLDDQMQIVSFNLPLSGVTDVQIPLAGSLVTVGSSATGDVTADWGPQGHHAFIKVNQLTTGGDLVIVGDSADEVTGVVQTDDTETITLYASAARPVINHSTYYQSDKKWLAITNIDVSSGAIAGINYNYGYVGYPDMGNRNFRFIGYRLEAYSEGPAPDLRFIWQKIDGQHGKKVMHIHTIEDIGIDSDSSGDQLIDHIRTGASDRSYNSPLTNLWSNGEMFVLKQLDIHTYWEANPLLGHEHQPNEINSQDTHSGYIIRLEGEPPGGGITNVQFVSLYLYYELY